MRDLESYVKQAKALLGNAAMSDRQLGELIGGVASSKISDARYGNMSDPLALKLAGVLGIPAGELLMVARLEREKDPAIRAALVEWAGNVFSLMPTKAAPVDLVRGGVRVPAGVRQNRSILPYGFRPSARAIVSRLQPMRAAMALIVSPRSASFAALAF